MVDYASKKDVNLYLDTIEGCWYFLRNKNIFLPSLSSRAIVKEYLEHIRKKNLLYFDATKVPHAVLIDRSISHEDLYQKWEERVKKIDPSVVHGFTKKRIPNL